MNVSLIIPFHSAKPCRLLAFSHIHTFFCQEFPGWTRTCCGDGREPFSRARAINEGVRRTEGDIVLINDADTLCRPQQIREAVAWAVGAAGLVFAYTRYRRLSREATARLSGPSDAFHGEVEWQMENAPSQSCVAIRRECFEAIGGYDERFEGWGYEDLAFSVACLRHWPIRRVPGDLYHLWHGERRADDSPVSADPEAIYRNWQLFEREYA